MCLLNGTSVLSVNGNDLIFDLLFHLTVCKKIMMKNIELYLEVWKKAVSLQR